MYIYYKKTPAIILYLHLKQVYIKYNNKPVRLWLQVYCAILLLVVLCGRVDHAHLVFVIGINPMSFTNKISFSCVSMYSFNV